MRPTTVKSDTSRPDGVIRCVVVDDEPLAREGIRLLLEATDDFRVVGECGTAAEAVARVREDPPDVLFLDIQMPGGSGFDFLGATGDAPPPVVVFVTAFDEHALEAFRVQALDYLVKPIDQDRFAKTLDRLRSRVEETRDGELGQRLRRAVAPASTGSFETGTFLKRIAIKSGDRIRFVPVANIDWVEAARDYVVLHASGEEYMLRKTMAGILEELDGFTFARIHRSSIVNVTRIRELRPSFHGGYVVILEDGTRLRVSRRYREELTSVLGTRL